MTHSQFDDDEEDFEAMLMDYDRWSDDPEVGQKVEGTILSIGNDVAFVDIGAKAEGTIDCAELLDEDGDLTVDVGQRIEAMVAAVDPSGTFVLRVRPGSSDTSADELRLAFEQKLPVEGLVTSEVKGGVEVMVGNLRAFCPVSQLDARYVESVEEYVGQRFQFRIRTFEGGGRRPNVVLSRRQLIEEEAARRAEELREYLEVGAILEGTVTSITTYGAFIDLGGLEGLLHASEMGHRRGIDPKQVVREGQRLEVQILKIEPPTKSGQTERISLSIKALQRDPWDGAAERYAVDSVVAGQVTNLESYGAFVELEPGLEGLVHISRLGGKGDERHARKVVQLGQSLRVRVVALDAEARRITLAREPDEKVAEDRVDVEEYLRSKTSTSEGFGSMGDFFKKR